MGGPSLSERVFSENLERQGSKDACALKVDKPCCKGKGYLVKMKGPRAHAELCSCVTNCPACFGAGMLIDKNGQSYSCRKLFPKRVVGLYNEARIPARYHQASLDQFANFTGNANQINGYIKKWVHNYELGNQGFILGGPVGVGKTYILTAVAADLVAKGISVRFIDFFQLLAEIKAGFSEYRSELSHIEPLLNVDVLIIDELGKGRDTDFEITVLDQLVMGRYNAGKTILASTNYYFGAAPVQDFRASLEDAPKRSKFDPDDFGSLEARVGKRIYSRFVETTELLEMDGRDFRKS